MTKFTTEKKVKQKKQQKKQDYVQTIYTSSDLKKLPAKFQKDWLKHVKVSTHNICFCAEIKKNKTKQKKTLQLNVLGLNNFGPWKFF